jgi:GNAT superfamily N-acetyltransferase
LLRLARPDEVSALEALMQASGAAIFPRFYDARQTASLLRLVAIPDSVLIDDGTYFALEAAGELVGCGGWTRRDRLYTGGNQTSRLLDPATEPAQVRAMYVRDDWTRRGLGRRIIAACEAAAAQEGFTRLALLATLPGVPLYRACGFEPTGDLSAVLGDGVEIECVAMEKPIAREAAAWWAGAGAPTSTTPG